MSDDKKDYKDLGAPGKVLIWGFVAGVVGLFGALNVWAWTAVLQ
jgi:hypothetical protein